MFGSRTFSKKFLTRPKHFDIINKMSRDGKNLENYIVQNRSRTKPPNGEAESI